MTVEPPPESAPEIQVNNQAIERIGREDSRRIKSNSLSLTEHDPEKRDKMRFEVINEIIGTEKTYVKDLETVVQVRPFINLNLVTRYQLFLHPLKSNKFLEEGELKAIFSNIEAILSINQEINENFQQALSKMPVSDIHIGELFLKTVRFQNSLVFNYQID